MSPARAHRDRLAQAGASEQHPDVTVDEGGQPTRLRGPSNPSRGVTPAYAHRLRHAARTASAAPAGSEDEENKAPDQPVEERRPATTAEAQIALRLTSDLRTLKDIQSVARKIEAKVFMLSEYRAWIGGVLDAVAAGIPPMPAGDGGAGDVLPTIMVWLIDTGAYGEALPLIETVLAHDVAMPARYARTGPTMIVEEIATAALKLQAMGERFDLDLLLHIEELTADRDMHDQVRAKLEKAIGEELFVAATAKEPGSEGFVPAYQAALEKLRQAHGHHDKVGVKDRIKRAEKAIAAVAPPTQEQAGSAG